MSQKESSLLCRPCPIPLSPPPLSPPSHALVLETELEQKRQKLELNFWGLRV